MTKLQQIIQTREWALRWLDTDADKLPGTLTHEKCFQVLRDAECDMVDFLAFNGKGMVYQDDDGTIRA